MPTVYGTTGSQSDRWARFTEARREDVRKYVHALYDHDDAHKRMSAQTMLDAYEVGFIDSAGTLTPLGGLVAKGAL